jgi:hypothetical protein
MMRAAMAANSIASSLPSILNALFSSLASLAAALLLMMAGSESTIRELRAAIPVCRRNARRDS